MDTGEQTKPFMVFIASTTADELFPQPSTFFLHCIHTYTHARFAALAAEFDRLMAGTY